MKTISQSKLRFYQQIGKIFYAIAAVDKKVRPEEIEAFKKIVQKEWLPLESSTDEFGTDAVFQMEIVFDWLQENDWNQEQTIPDFIIFKEAHSDLFTEKVRSMILKTAHAIANAFSGKNKAELVLLSQLQTILSK